MQTAARCPASLRFACDSTSCQTAARCPASLCRSVVCALLPSVTFCRCCPPSVHFLCHPSPLFFSHFLTFLFFAIPSRSHLDPISPLYGSAVKIVGWGTENNTKYWKVTNFDAPTLPPFVSPFPLVSPPPHPPFPCPALPASHQSSSHKSYPLRLGAKPFAQPSACHPLEGCKLVEPVLGRAGLLSHRARDERVWDRIGRRRQLGRCDVERAWHLNSAWDAALCEPVCGPLSSMHLSAGACSRDSGEL